MKTSIKIQLSSIIPFIAAGLMAVAVATAPGFARAADEGEALTKKVAYGDLNLESPKGVEVLYARLRNAAREVCTPFEGRDLSRQVLWGTCYEHAISAAVSAINKPAVTAYHNQAVRQGAKS